MPARPRSSSGRVSASVLSMVVMAVVAMAWAAVGCGTPVSRIAVTEAVTPVPPTPDQAVVYLKITNSGDLDDELLGATTSEAPMAHLHSNKITDNGLSTMSTTSQLAIPAGKSVRLEAGALHIMLMEPKELVSGASFDLTLNFREAGAVTTRVRVVTQDELSQDQSAS